MQSANEADTDAAVGAASADAEPVARLREIKHNNSNTDYLIVSNEKNVNEDNPNKNGTIGGISVQRAIPLALAVFEVSAPSPCRDKKHAQRPESEQSLVGLVGFMGLLAGFLPACV